MEGATGAAVDPVHVLVGLAAVLGEVYAGPEHAADARVPLVEPCVVSCGKFRNSNLYVT